MLWAGIKPWAEWPTGPCQQPMHAVEEQYYKSALGEQQEASTKLQSTDYLSLYYYCSSSSLYPVSIL
jgi:hypothetical protein